MFSSSPMTRLLLLFLTTVSLLFRAVHADCYWPDGTENDAYQPCYSSHGGAIGLCCAAGDVCISNGVCMQQAAQSSDDQGDSDDDDDNNNNNSTAYYRGSCTFRDWSQGKNCPTVCLKGPGTSQHEAVDMFLCPGSDTDWYCGDGNKKKANCTTGDYIVSLAEPDFFTTIGVSPSMTGSPEPTSPPTALGGGFGSATTTSAPAPASTTNSTLPGPESTSGTDNAQPSGTPSGTPSAQPSGTESALPASSSTTETSPGDSGSASPAPPPPEESSTASNSSAVPLAVGVSIGGASIIGAGVLGFFLWRRRRSSSSSLARAETPPPRDTPDDDAMNTMLDSSLFRAGSLIRHPSHEYMNIIGRSGPTSPEAVATASVYGGDRTSSLRSNSMRSNITTQAHHVRSVSQDRFGADAVAMHDMRSTPPAGWGYPRARNGPAETIPEIPFDGRRLPPYHGTPVFENGGFYSELPG